MSDYPIFSVLGIEIEYMLVDRDTLDVVPKSDIILTQLAGKRVNEVVLGDIAISNELVMHIVELKSNGPKPPSPAIAQQFHETILQLQPLLQGLNIQLLPTGAHPWMDPLLETKRWPHNNTDIYHQFDSIFNCQGHGWSNLQSMHVNLPFANDEEFCRLHNSIRLLLPLIPALAASTPFLNGQKTGMSDSRLHYYALNQLRIPCITGDIIPDFIRTQAQYQHTILGPMYKAISPFDPKGILQYEWLNSRAAIPKFSCKAIEIRIIDSQECPQADLAIALAIHTILKNWQNNSSYYLDNPCDTRRLRTIYDQSIKNGLDAYVDDAELCKQWQLPTRGMSMREIWSHLLQGVSHDLDNQSQRVLEHILSQGNLSDRIVHACRNNYDKQMLKQVYSQLGNCLLTNQPLGL